MVKYQRVKGGEKNEKTGLDWSENELKKVCSLYIELEGKGIHERNPKIHDLANELNRTVRSVENQLLGFRIVESGDTGRKNHNKIIDKVWEERFAESEAIIETSSKKILTSDNNKLQFKISSALKDIIGRDLITDDFVAVFELVKNAYDAYATEVTVRFENLGTPKSKIIIKDNGKGMDYNDLINKWLFVAYSAKKEGTEDDSFDYRDSIYVNRPFAGAKGIGRFSCDRLGKYLYLESTKKEKNSKTEILVTEWEKFESNIHNEFVDIDVLHDTTTESSFGLNHGTVLIIENLRNEWDRAKLLRLKDSLAKLINPTSSKTTKTFRITLDVPDEKAEDLAKKEYYDIVNGEIENFIFETLGLKTTKITSNISEDGKTIETELRDGGTLIYRITEANQFHLLNNINYTLYYLNMSAKMTFTRRMGLSSNQYGHVFLYKNGFRIYPYGEPGEDPLQIDVRKAQGTRRYLGTRELIGSIEVFNNSDELKETSSRGDGLIKTPTYIQLEKYFWEVLRKLERYVVEVQQWGMSIEDDFTSDINKRITNYIAKLSGSSTIINFQYADNFLKILEDSQTSSAEKVIKNLNKIAFSTGNEDLIKEASKAANKLLEIQAAREEAEREAEQQRIKAELAARELKEKLSENLFLQSVKSQDLNEIVSFIHHIGISSSIIDNYLTGLYSELDYDDFNSDDAKKIIKLLLFENKKVLNISRFATKANFKLTTDAIELDIVNYLKEYIQNIIELSNNDETKIEFINHVQHAIVKKFKPIELNILIDNFLSNSKKARAKHFSVDLTSDNKDGVYLKIIDDGHGIDNDNIAKIFNFGYTTLTGGSGIGLYHVKEIIDRLHGTINVQSGDAGTVFTIFIK